MLKHEPPADAVSNPKLLSCLTRFVFPTRVPPTPPPKAVVAAACRYTGTYFDALREAHAAAPDKALVATEMCDCPVSIDQAWLWNKAERQAFDTLGDLNNWVELWLDWNLILDENGGPSHAGYSCGASVISDHTGKFGRGSVLYQPNYYYTVRLESMRASPCVGLSVFERKPWACERMHSVPSS